MNSTTRVIIAALKSRNPSEPCRPSFVADAEYGEDGDSGDDGDAGDNKGEVFSAGFVVEDTSEAVPGPTAVEATAIVAVTVSGDGAAPPSTQSSAALVGSGA